MMLFTPPRKVIFMTELKSLKNPTRILSILMFFAVFIVAIGPEALGQALPFIPQATIVGIVTACGWAVNQYGTESRVVRAEDIKEDEFAESELQVDEDGV